MLLRSVLRGWLPFIEALSNLVVFSRLRALLIKHGLSPVSIFSHNPIWGDKFYLLISTFKKLHPLFLVKLIQRGDPLCQHFRKLENMPYAPVHTACCCLWPRHLLAPHISYSPLTRKFLGGPSLDYRAPGLCGEVEQGFPFYCCASVAWCYQDMWLCPPESAAPNPRNSRAALSLSREGLFLRNLTAQLSIWISLAFGEHVRLILTSIKNSCIVCGFIPQPLIKKAGQVIAASWNWGRGYCCISVLRRVPLPLTSFLSYF